MHLHRPDSLDARIDDAVAQQHDALLAPLLVTVEAMAKTRLPALLRRAVVRGAAAGRTLLRRVALRDLVLRCPDLQSLALGVLLVGGLVRRRSVVDEPGVDGAQLVGPSDVGGQQTEIGVLEAPFLHDDALPRCLQNAGTERAPISSCSPQAPVVGQACNGISKCTVSNRGSASYSVPRAS